MEVLAPAGNLHKLLYAYAYGADAAYIGLKRWGLRAKADNFDEAELKQAVALAKKFGKKLFVTLNIFAHNSDLQGLPETIENIYQAGIDAVIVSDPGIFAVVKRIAPKLNIHVSTQANITSYESAAFWQSIGASRVILARELSLPEIASIKQKLPDLEVEMFAHGAMCVAYSGRCLLSAFLNNRSANRGLCTQPCRWEYSVIEKSRPTQNFDLEETEKGTFMFNSKDLCLYERLEEIYNAGIDSIKIEGRMKSLYYAANVSRVYRTAVDMLMHSKKPTAELRHELDKVSHRIYSNGFIDGLNADDMQNYDSSAYIREWQFLGEVVRSEGSKALIDIKAKFSIGDEIDFIFPDISKDFTIKVNEILEQQGDFCESTRPNTLVWIETNRHLPEHGIIRKKL